MIVNFLGFIRYRGINMCVSFIVSTSYLIYYPYSSSFIPPYSLLPTPSKTPPTSHYQTNYFSGIITHTNTQKKEEKTQSFPPLKHAQPSPFQPSPFHSPSSLPDRYMPNRFACQSIHSTFISLHSLP